MVLMYHGIGQRAAAADPYNLFVPAADLAVHLTFLLERGWRPLRLAEYLAGEAPDRGSTAAQDGDAAMGGRNAGKDNHQAGNLPAGRLQEVADD